MTTAHTQAAYLNKDDKATIGSVIQHVEAHNRLTQINDLMPENWRIDLKQEPTSRSNPQISFVLTVSRMNEVMMSVSKNPQDTVENGVHLREFAEGAKMSHLSSLVSKLQSVLVQDKEIMRQAEQDKIEHWNEVFAELS